ncbi:hypothetical protein ANN_08769 [Periplaneta americana]|uniref:Endonuclease/exonuclease/phosphatase domain-containing protein n=1 Tax=Periplaneta americana TaxID=6978 RepID=A0ABQ8T2E1_PERAM|nr:hypothetical protein ANN_08769 [Periplaneta americana]
MDVNGDDNRQKRKRSTSRSESNNLLLATETKLTHHIPGYIAYGAGHPSGVRKGASAIFIKSDLKHSELVPIIETEIQVARIQITFEGNELQIASFYSAAANRVTMAHFWDIIHIMKTHFLIGDDFNSKHPRWGSNTTNPRVQHYVEAITETQIPLKTPKDIDIAVSTLTRNIQFAANVDSSHSQNYKNKNRVPFTSHIRQLYFIKEQYKLLWEQTKYSPYKTKLNGASRELSKVLRNQHQTAMENKLKSLMAEDGTIWQRTKFAIKHTDSRTTPFKICNQWFSRPEQKVKVFSE